MKRLLFILLISIPMLPSFGQTLENDSLNFTFERKTLGGSTLRDNRYPSLRERHSFEEQSSLDKESPVISGGLKRPDSLTMNMTVYVPEFYQGPLYNYLSDSEYPYANDYAYYAGYRLSDRSWLTTSSTHDTYLFVGSLYNIGGRYNYMLTDNLTLSAGAYILKYGDIGTFTGGYKIRNDAGVNAALKYQITDRIAIHGFGQYSAFGKRNKLDSSYAPWYPTSNFGAAFEYRVSKGFGIMGGVERQLNPMTGKWKNVPFLAPVFYGK